MQLSELSQWLGVLKFAAGAVTAIVGAVLSRKWPHMLLWKLSPMAPATICLATSARINTGKYVRPTTGIGQVQALALVVPSVLRGYGVGSRPKVVFSDQVSPDLLKRDLILLGGAKNNEYTRRIFEEYSQCTAFEFIKDMNTFAFEGEEYTGVTRGGRVVEDWAIIMRVPNPYSEGATQVTVLAGVHTHGVAAAAEYYVTRMINWNSILRRHFICLVKVEVVGSETIRPRLFKMKKVKP